MVGLLKFLAALPFGVLYVLADVLAWVAADVLKYRKKVVLQNLRNSFPEMSEQEIRQTARKFYTNLADVLVETLKASDMSREQLRERAKVLNPEILLPYKESGVMLVGGHHANWEWLFMVCSNALPVPIDGPYKPLKNKAVNDYLLNVRKKFGGNPIPKDVSTKVFIKNRNTGRAVGLLADQLPMESTPKHWATFLNQDTAFYLGMEQIAKLLQYPVYFFYMRRVKRGYYEIEIVPLAQPPYAKDKIEVLDQFAALSEALIRESPADWLWSHKRWKYAKPQAEASA